MRSLRLIAVACMVAVLAACSPPKQGAHASATSVHVGDCTDTTVKIVTTRLYDDHGNVPGSGSAIEYTNGINQVSYDQIPEVDTSKPGDAIHLCLTQLPTDCPPGDNRGKIYSAINRRTRGSWTLPDSEHSCGGA